MRILVDYRENETGFEQLKIYFTIRTALSINEFFM